MTEIHTSDLVPESTEVDQAPSPCPIPWCVEEQPFDQGEAFHYGAVLGEWKQAAGDPTFEGGADADIRFVRYGDTSQPHTLTATYAEIIRPSNGSYPTLSEPDLRAFATWLLAAADRMATLNDGVR